MAWLASGTCQDGSQQGVRKHEGRRTGAVRNWAATLGPATRASQHPASRGSRQPCAGWLAPAAASRDPWRLQQPPAATYSHKQPSSQKQAQPAHLLHVGCEALELLAGPLQSLLVLLCSGGAAAGGRLACVGAWRRVLGSSRGGHGSRLGAGKLAGGEQQQGRQGSRQGSQPASCQPAAATRQPWQAGGQGRGHPPDSSS